VRVSCAGRGLEAKEAGNVFYKQKQYDKAIEQYSKAIGSVQHCCVLCHIQLTLKYVLCLASQSTSLKKLRTTTTELLPRLCC
jgi:tetratricopeptide (TPR) repeat protein